MDFGGLVNFVKVADVLIYFRRKGFHWVVTSTHRLGYDNIGAIDKMGMMNAINVAQSRLRFVHAELNIISRGVPE
jgi:hypothetical protein